MTGYTVHTGSTKKFATNWDQIFTGKQGKTAQKTPARKPDKASSKSTKKKA